MSMEILLLVGSLLIMFSIVASQFSARFSIPILAVFLVVGILAGSEGIGKIEFNNVNHAKMLGIVALSFILFSGGLDTNYKRTRLVMWEGLTLSTIGVIVSAFVVGFFVHLILGRNWAESFLLGAVISSTDAAAVFSILRSRNVKLKGALKPLLEFESASNDPCAAFLTIVMIQILTMPQLEFGNVMVFLLKQVIWGVGLGIGLSRLLEWVIRKLDLQYEGLYPVLTFSFVLFTYSITSLLDGNGFLAVYLLGLSLSRFELRHKGNLIMFHDSIAWLMQAVMFTTLGLLVFPSSLMSVAFEGILVAIILFFVARPIAVFLCLTPFRMPKNEKILISWVGLRGAAPIVLATFPLSDGVKGSDFIFNIVFFVVLLSVLIQGTTITEVARKLGLDASLEAAQEAEEAAKEEAEKAAREAIEAAEDAAKEAAEQAEKAVKAAQEAAEAAKEAAEAAEDAAELKQDLDMQDAFEEDSVREAAAQRALEQEKQAVKQAQEPQNDAQNNAEGQQ
ncbi:cell volume regulation protein A [Elusimicrobium posterum]|uniref:potassium/proton antiporter n=1 Tax=Elusimicrobium posterum TaxID=3116653 RepID=UPI003C732424